jgi:hypothetical protein
METQAAPEKAMGSVPITPTAAPYHIEPHPVNGIHPYRQPFYKGRPGRSFSLSNMSTKRRRITVITLAMLLLVLIIGLAAGLAKRAQYVRPASGSHRARFIADVSPNSAVALPLPRSGHHTGADVLRSRHGRLRVRVDGAAECAGDRPRDVRRGAERRQSEPQSAVRDADSDQPREPERERRQCDGDGR